MGLRVLIEEEATLRRLAGALATSLSKSARFEGRIDLELSTGVFFRSFPWTGEIIVAEGLPAFESSTAGQYFMEFNWEGKPVRGLEERSPKFASETALSTGSTSTDGSSVSGILDRLFGQE